MDKKFEPLFTPWKIGNVEIKNRIVLCPMGGTSLFGWMEPHHFDKEAANFILNLADATSRRYLKVGVAMELSKTQEEIELASMPAPKASGHGASAPVDPNEAIIAEMERYKPAIRDAIISVLSNKTSDELSTPTGKEIAKEEILAMVNNIFEGKREVMRVSFGQFIIQ